MGFHEVLECSITFRMLLSPSIGFYAMFSEFGPSLSYLILSYLIFCLPAGFWCWDDFKYPRGYPHVRQHRSSSASTISPPPTHTSHPMAPTPEPGWQIYKEWVFGILVYTAPLDNQSYPSQRDGFLVSWWCSMVVHGPFNCDNGHYLMSFNF